ncbi:hypothetical protein ABVT39_005339 [Epinephelus coioides]
MFLPQTQQKPGEAVTLSGFSNGDYFLTAAKMKLEFKDAFWDHASEMDQDHASEMDDMKMLHKSAQLIRRSIVNFNKKEQSGMNILSKVEDVPVELYSLIQWILSYCVPYNRTLLLETAIANAVVENSKRFSGLDFAEDTVDEKGTTHGTITAVYQKANAQGEVIAPSLELEEAKNQFLRTTHPSSLAANPNAEWSREHKDLRQSHVETILLFIEASRNADLVLHLQAGEALSKLFFALDRMKYKCLWPRYIADMQDLKTSHPDTWHELQDGNISVTKSEIPFVSIGADHACEQLNQMMKIRSGLIGISNNAKARQRFFLATPEMSRLSTEYKEQFGIRADEPQAHHEVQASAIQKEHDAVNKIKSTILSHGNPFDAEGDQLYSFMTHAYVPQENALQILNVGDYGQKSYKEYVAERINGNVSFWAPIKKRNNAMFLSGNKKQSVKIRDQ